MLLDYSLPVILDPVSSLPSNPGHAWWLCLSDPDSSRSVQSKSLHGEAQGLAASWLAPNLLRGSTTWILLRLSRR